MTLPTIDRDYLTTPDWVLLDPNDVIPPPGVKLLVLNPGGVLHVGMWYDGALAWAPMPKIPGSVKSRMSGVKDDTTVLSLG